MENHKNRRLLFWFRKIIIGEFHSGSQNFDYGMPPDNCLELAKEVTEKYNFKYVSIDIFLTSDGLYLINEIQPYFAQKDDRELLRINNKTVHYFLMNLTESGSLKKENFAKIICRICELRKLLNNSISENSCLIRWGFPLLLITDLSSEFLKVFLS